MKKFILLTTALLSSANVWGACTPPITFKCNCAHPIIENGQLACGTSYCGDKKCMPDGSCCETNNYCESNIGKQCCSDSQTCDATNGCVEAVNECNGKNDYTLCQNGNGYCYEGYCLTRGSLHSQCTQLVNIRNSLEYCEAGAALSCWKENEFICHTFEAGDPPKIYEECYSASIRPEGEYEYEMSQCPSGKGGICILNILGGTREEIAEGRTNEYHYGGVCID